MFSPKTPTRLPTKHTSTSTSTSAPPRFSRLLGTVLGSPFLTTNPDSESPHFDLVDGSLTAVPRAFTIPRPVSPTPSDFSIISAPAAEYSYPSPFNTPSRRIFYSSPNLGAFTNSSPNPIRSLLPRLWDVFSSPSPKKSPDFSDYSSLPPLDGEEGELVDDEACFVDVRAITGIDILLLLPPELSTYILASFLELPDLIACAAVSRSWRALVSDNMVWRGLLKGEGWKVSFDKAKVNDKFVYNRVTNPRMKTLPPLPGQSPPPPNLDWKTLYQERLELERRWVGKASGETANEPAVVRLTGHSDSVYCLEFDASRIITGSRDRSIKVWSLKTGRLLGTFKGHQGSVLCLKFDASSMDETTPGFMVSGSSDCSVRVWDLYTLEPTGEAYAEVRAVLNGHEGGVLDLRIDDKWIVSCSKDASIHVWNRETLAVHRTLHGHQGPVNAVGLQSGKVVSASGDGNMILWDIESGERLRTFEGHDRGLACIEFKDDMIVSGSNDCKIKVWSASTGQCLRTLEGHEALVRALSFDPRSGRLVSASYDKAVKVWDLRTGKMIRDFKDSHTSHIFDVKFDHARIVSTSHDQKIVILDFSHGLDVSLFTR